MKILLIEDNKIIADSIQKYFALENKIVEIASDGTHGEFLRTTRTYDVIILDRMLPGISGEQLCKKMRGISSTPVIMTTAKGQLEDKLEGFSLGADDYLVKPFDLEELSARIDALLRRIPAKTVFNRHTIEIDLSKRRICKDGGEVYLTIKEYLIIEKLLHSPGVAVSRSDIIEYVWGGEELWEENGKLDVYISTIRKKLDKKFIQTLPGFGYKIERDC